MSKERITMGILGTMVVNFTANVSGLQSGVNCAHLKEAHDDFSKRMDAITEFVKAAVEGDRNIEVVSSGILDMTGGTDEKTTQDQEDIM